MQKDQIISALIGLVGACSIHPKTDNTDRLILKALAQSCADDAGTAALVVEIHAEKHRVAPGCALCAMPCGNTSDYDMCRIYNACDPIREMKLQIIAQLRETAVALQSRQTSAPFTGQSMDVFYKALSYLSYDMEPETLRGLLEEIRASGARSGQIDATA